MRAGPGKKSTKLMEDLGRKRQLPLAIEMTARKLEVTLPTPACHGPSPEEIQVGICRVGLHDHLTGGL